MPTRDENSRRREEKILKARALRAQHAAAAAFYANRVEKARAASRYGTIGHWTNEYRHAASRCRLLGELIRNESTEANGGPGATVLQMAPKRSGQQLSRTGEAA